MQRIVLGCTRDGRAGTHVVRYSGHRAAVAFLLDKHAMKIRSHLLLLVLGVVVPILAFSTVMTVVFWREQRHALEQRYLDRARAMAIALDRELDGTIRALQVLAASPALQA